MSSTFTEAQLFGGAMTALIPSRFADVSTIRQVPDNQEVYLDADGFTSLTFDITERVCHLSTDKEALEYHFTDIVAEEDRKEILSVDEAVRLPHLQSSTPILSLIAKVTPPTNPNPRPLTPTHTTMYVTLIRLLEQAADIVITLNVPTIPESPGTRNEAMMREMVSKLGASFEIKDWNLFNGK